MTISSPLKLDTTYNPAGLWNFDGDLLDEGFAGDDLTVARGDTTYAWGHAYGTKGFFFRDSNVGIDGAANAALQTIGDVTVQAVIRWSEMGAGSFGSEILTCKGASSGPEANNVAWGLMIQNISANLTPEFIWQHGAGTTVRVQAPSTFTLTPSRWYHMVGRRTDVGGGQSLGELFVNGTLIASATYTNATGATTSYVTLGLDAVSNVDLKKSTISSAKVVNRALTDAELSLEFTRVREAIR